MGDDLEKQGGCVADRATSSFEDTTDVVKARYIFWVLGMLGMAIVYALRGNLSIAIVAMVNHTAIANLDNTTKDDVVSVKDDICPGDNEEALTSEDGELVWSSAYQGFILSGFFYGYAVGQVPGGMLAEKFQGKIVFGLGVLVTSLLTVISPFTVHISGSVFFVVRLLEGFAESMTSPALQYMVTKWAPLQERNRFSAVFSGSFIGNIICKPISGLLCSLDVAGGWPMVFYLFGVIGVAWCISWQFLVYDTPATHPRISKEERRYIESSIGTHQEKKDLPTPWKDIARCRGLWACYFMYFGIGWNLYTLFIGLPSYLEGVLRYSIMNNALLSSIPYISACVSSIIFSSILDFLLTNRFVSSLTGLKIINGIAAVTPATALLGVTLAGCDRTWIVLLFGLNGVAMGANYIGVTTNLIALAHNFAGTTYGITNSVSNIASILAPYVIGFLTNHKQSRHQWNIVFYISAAISYSTFVAYLLMCSDKEQPWNNSPKSKGNQHNSDE